MFLPNICTISSILIVNYASRINNDIPGCEICTLSWSSLMRVSRILQLFSPLSLNVTNLRRIYGGILDNLSMPSILVIHIYLFILQQNQQWLKSLPCKCLEYTRGGAYWQQDKTGVRFTHECVKCTQIADPERTQSELKIFKSESRANPGSELRVRSGFARVLGSVLSVL
jgi:hypothetical protein